MNTFGIRFTSNGAVRIFGRVAARQFVPTKFAEHGTLDILGVAQGVRHLLNKIGCADLLNIYARSYQHLTLEVLSSFSHSFNERWMRFRVNNREYQLGLDEVGDIFGCPRNDMGDPFDPSTNYQLPTTQFWRQITGTNQEYDPRRAKSSSILHPCLRIAHRILSNTLFCRTDSGTVLQFELYLLYGMVNPNLNISVDGGAWIAQKLAKNVEAVNGEVCCCGLITHLVTQCHFRIPLPDDDVHLEGLDRLNLEAFHRMHMIERQGNRYSWKIGRHSEHHSYLPNPARTHVTDHTNWLYPPVGDEGQEAPQEQPQAHNEQPAQHAFHAHQQPPFYDFDARFNALTLQVGENRQEIQSLQQSVQGLQQSSSQQQRSLEEIQRGLYGYFQYHGYQYPPPGP